MNEYSLMPHTADIRLQVQGVSVEKIFANALEGMNRILNKEYNKHLNKHVISKNLNITSPDISSLLIDFLSEVLTLSQIHNAIFHIVDQLELHDSTLSAQIIGAKINKFDEDIKAVSYHEANVVRNDKGNLETTIVFDI